MKTKLSPPVSRILLAIFSTVSTLIVWGMVNSGHQKEPASVQMDTTNITSAKDSRSGQRGIVLNKASHVDSGKSSTKEQSVLFNDPFIQEKWGLTKTNATRAWSITKGSRDIIVAVIDTGIDAKHKDLSGNLWTNPGETGLDKNGNNKATNGIDDDGNGFVDDVHGWNFVSNNNDLTDNHGHGTHISGIIGAQGDNGFGIAGVSPEVSLMTLKYYDPKAPGTNNLKNTINAIKYAVKMGAKIINYSGGGTEFSAEEKAAVQLAEKKGILFVAAAGNERSNTDNPETHYYPADYGLSNIISVTAVNEKDTKVLPSSNYGVRTVDLAAPGDQIYSTLPGNSFGKMTGTSQATAFTTGVAVLVMAHRPELDVADVKKYILRTGDEYATLLSKTGTAKLLNAYKALTNLDMGLSITGQATVNTERTSPKAFSSDSVDHLPQLGPSALGADYNLKDPTEEISSFGRGLIKAVGLPTGPRGPSTDSSEAPNEDPNK